MKSSAYGKHLLFFLLGKNAKGLACGWNGACSVSGSNTDMSVSSHALLTREMVSAAQLCDVLSVVLQPAHGLPGQWWGWVSHPVQP